MSISQFMDTHYRHFNAAAMVDAAKGYNQLIASGGKMFLTLAGAMSTAELGQSLAEMIRQDKVHAISCTGANLEEDIFNLVAHNYYERVPHYRDLTPQQEQLLLDKQMNRVTDTCIPEEEAMRVIEHQIVEFWKEADHNHQPLFPHQFIFKLIEKWEALPAAERPYQIDRKDSWLIAAYEKNLPIYVPGWEDSTLGNIFASKVISQQIKNPHTVRSGIEYMVELTRWYREQRPKYEIGFFQIGGGIAGDFPICVVPMINQDLQSDPEIPLWSYFCQISDSTTSYGSYSGAVPNEKITWGKLGIETPKYIIESDATIVAPLVFAYVLGW